jgi:hypothetical protein
VRESVRFGCILVVIAALLGVSPVVASGALPATPQPKTLTPCNRYRNVSFRHTLSALPTNFS